jgi:T5SS/PEP-CTERM-associated repeat protein
MGTVTDAQASIGGGTVYINVGGIWTTTASASNGNGFIYVGNDGLAGTLTVVSGGTVNCGALVVDLASIVNVTGSLDVGYNPAAGSAGGGLFISQAESGPPSGSMTIQGGSAVNSGPGQIDNGGSVTVSDSNSSWSVGGGLSVGSQSDGSLTIQNGGLVKVTGTAVVAALAGVVGSSGTVLVEDTNSLFACSDLDVGGTDTAAGGVGVFRLTEDASAQVGSVLNIWGNGTVDVAGGAMTVGSKVTLATIGQILINSGGTVKGNGTVVASAGIPIEVAEGGILAPGSPGALKIVQPNFVHVDDDVTNDLTIDGDFQDDPGGTLDMQITGADAADYGHLTVTGTSDIQGSVLLDFMDGFGPQTGDVYDLFSFDGGANDFSGDIQVMGLAPGWLYQIEQVGDEEEIESLNNGTATTPEPASAAWLLAAGLLLRQRRYERCRGPKLVA